MCYFNISISFFFREIRMNLPFSFFFLIFFIFIQLYHGEKIHFHGKKIDCFRGKVFNFTGYFPNFFHVHQLEFHGHDFCKISRASLPFHGDFFKVFQTFSRAFFFSRATFSFFFQGYDFDFHGKKKTLQGSANAYVIFFYILHGLTKQKKQNCAAEAKKKNGPLLIIFVKKIVLLRLPLFPFCKFSHKIFPLTQFRQIYPKCI